MIIGYICASSNKQMLEIQREEITKFTAYKDFSVDKWITEVVEEKSKQAGEKLKEVLTRLKKGDVLIVTELARLSRTLYELMEVLSNCLERGITVYSINDRYLFDDKLDSKVMIKAFKLTEEIDRILVSARTKDALTHIKNSGRKLGRPQGSDSKQFFLDNNKEEVMNMLERGESVGTICEHFNVSKNTYYKFKKNFGIK